MSVGSEQERQGGAGPDRRSNDAPTRPGRDTAVKGLRIATLESVESLGIAIWKFPFFRAVKRAFPGCHITHVVSRKTNFTRGLAPLMPGYIDRLIEDAEIEKPLATARRNLKALDHADLVFDLRTKAARVIAARLSMPHTDFVTMLPGWALTTRIRARRPRPLHWVGRLMAMLEVATGDPADWRGTIALPDAAHAAAAHLLPAGPRYVGLAPGAAGQEKVWPLDRFIDLAGVVSAQGLTPVFLIGPAEQAKVAQIRAALPDARMPEVDRADPHQDVGGPTLALALAERLDAAVANCTGIGHLLACAGTPLVSLSGPTDPRRFLPWTEPVRSVRAQNFGGTADMAAIPIDAVLAQVDGVLQDAARGGATGPDPYTHGRR